jgi:hypothetical protein
VTVLNHDVAGQHLPSFAIINLNPKLSVEHEPIINAVDNVHARTILFDFSARPGRFAAHSAPVAATGPIAHAAETTEWLVLERRRSPVSQG